MNLLRNLASFIRPGTEGDHAVHPLLAQAIGEINCPLIGVPAYAKQLVPALEFAHDYYTRLVTAIPGPYDILPATYGDHPALRALFPSAAEITIGLGRSLEVKDRLQLFMQQGHAHLHALLAMRRRRRGADGSISSAIFGDHTFRSLGATDFDARSNLRAAAFSRLLKEFGAQVSLLHRKKRLYRDDWTIYDALYSREGGELEGVDGFVYSADELKPEKVLRGLVAFLLAPEAHFCLAPLVPPGAEEGVPDDTKYMVLRANDRRDWIVCTARFSSEDARQAIEQERHSHRYLFI